MFGTVARVTVQPGKEQEFLAIGEQWARERGPSSGETASYAIKLEGRAREYFIVGVFTDRAAYYANANDPETDRWYRQLRATLEADPEWNDGEFVQAFTFDGI
jgi:quinol monooxygenase YgiN